MGEMADWVNEQVEDEEDLRLEFHVGTLSDQEAFDAGIIDERGYERIGYERILFIKEVGPGACPICGGKTHLVEKGQFGPFYGCDSFPKCKGSRNLK